MDADQRQWLDEQLAEVGRILFATPTPEQMAERLALLKAMGESFKAPNKWAQQAAKFYP